MNTVSIDAFGDAVEDFAKSVKGGERITVQRDEWEGTLQSLTISYDDQSTHPLTAFTIDLAPEHPSAQQISPGVFHVIPEKVWVSGKVSGLAFDLIALLVVAIGQDRVNRIEPITRDVASGKLPEKLARKILHRERAEAFRSPLDLDAIRDFTWRWGEGASFDPFTLIADVHRARTAINTFSEADRAESRAWLEARGIEVPEGEYT